VDQRELEGYKRVGFAEGYATGYTKAMERSVESAKLTTAPPPIGLKDHQIAELISEVKGALLPCLKDPPQCLREIIHGAVVGYLEPRKLRIDHERRLKLLKEPDA
jgi:hypothetical protein